MRPKQLLLIVTHVLGDVLDKFGVGGEDSRESLLELLHGLDRNSVTGITGSFDRRRFLGNNKNACEASGEPDTTDSDCHKRRYEMLQDYYTDHVAIKRGDKAMVLGEYDVEGILEQTLNNIEQYARAVAGNGGTLSKPSSSDGLIADIKKLGDTASQLQRASVASVSVLYDSVLNFTDVSSASVGRMKTNIAAAYSDLNEKVVNATAKQGVRASNNSQIMITDANKAFGLSVDAIGKAQNSTSGAVINATALNNQAVTNFQLNVTNVQSKLSDAEDMVDSTDTSLKKQTDFAAQNLADSIGSAAQGVADAGQAKIDAVTKNAQGVVESLQGQTDREIDTAKTDWLSAAGSAAGKAANITNQAQAYVSGATDKLTDSISTASTNASEAIKSTQSDIQLRAQDASRTIQDTSAAASQLSSSVNDAVSGVSAQKQQAVSNAESGAATSQQQLSELSKSASSTTGGTVQSVLSGINEAQAQAQAQRMAAEGKSQEDIAKFLESVGMNGNQVATSLASLQSTIASGQAKASQEIEAHFAQANGQANSASSSLEGKLDQVGSAISDSESQFANSATSANAQLKSQLNGGVSLTGAQLDQVDSSNRGTNAKLLESILAGNQDFVNQGGDMEALLQNLKGAAGSINGGLGSADDALSGTAKSADAQVADLFGDLGDSDDDALEKIRKETIAQRDSLNSFASKFGNDQSAKMKDMWTQVSEALKQQEAGADQVSDKAEVAEQGNLNKGDRLSQIAASLQGNVDSLVSDGSSKADLAKNDFADRIKQQAAKDGNMVSALQGVLNKYEGDAMGDIGGYLQQLINSQHSSIDNGLDKQKSLVSSMSAASAAANADSAKLSAVLDALSRSSGNSRSSIINKVLALLSRTDQGTSSFSDKIGGLKQQLLDAQGTSAQALSALTKSIQSEVLKIPMILTSGAARLQNDFELASTDLDNNIQKLKEKLATAQTDEEREEAMQGLVVLNKLQGIQEGVREADQKLRSQIQTNAQSGQIDASNVQGAMTSVLSAMSSINSQMGTTSIAVQAHTQSIGEQTATLVNGMGMMVNSTSDQLAHDASESVVESRFNLNMADARNKVRLAAATRGVNGTLNVFTKNAQQVSDQEGMARDEIDSLSQTTKDTGLAISARIEDILNQVTANAAKIKSDSSEGTSDVLTRLALVRMAMSKFLGLWNQFAASTDRKLQRFHSADSEFISQMENDIKQKLGGSESAVNATSAQIAGLKTRIQMSMKDEIEYENQFTVKIQELKDTLKRLNNDRTSHNLESNDLVNEFENYEIENMGSLKENVKQLIDAFDDKVAGHVNDMDAFHSVSLIEKQIHRLDQQVARLES